MIENLVLEGGGVKGVAFCGAIRALEEKNLMKNIKNIIGSSAGAIIALAISIKLSSYEIEKIMKDIDFNKFLDKRWGIINKLYHFISKYGIYKGDYFLHFIEKILLQYTGNKNITFLELHKKYKTNLIITGTNLDLGVVQYFNYVDYPNMPVKTAIRISMCIPFFFEAVKYNNDLYVDGGVLNNYPFNYFTKYKKTLGFKLTGADEYKDCIIHHYDKEVKNIKNYSYNLIKALLNQIERLYINEHYWKRTITINTLGVSTTDFNLENSVKDKLISEGYRSTMEYLNFSSNKHL